RLARLRSRHIPRGRRRGEGRDRDRAWLDEARPAPARPDRRTPGLAAARRRSRASRGGPDGGPAARLGGGGHRGRRGEYGLSAAAVGIRRPGGRRVARTRQAALTVRRAPIYAHLMKQTVDAPNGLRWTVKRL